MPKKDIRRPVLWPSHREEKLQRLASYQQHQEGLQYTSLEDVADIVEEMTGGSYAQSIYCIK